MALPPIYCIIKSQDPVESYSMIVWLTYEVTIECDSICTSPGATTNTKLIPLRLNSKCVEYQWEAIVHFWSYYV